MPKKLRLLAGIFALTLLVSGYRFGAGYGEMNVPASQVSVNTDNLNSNLSSLDNTVQKALDTIDNLSLGGGGVEYTGVISGLPGSGDTGDLAVVTDGNADNDCGTGGGSTVNLCIWTGSAWTIAGDGTTASGADNVSVNGSATTDPDFVSTGGVIFTNNSNIITAAVNWDDVETIGDQINDAAVNWDDWVNGNMYSSAVNWDDVQWTDQTDYPSGCSATQFISALGDTPTCGQPSDVTGNAATATALAANGSNCSSGNAPLGVDASGASEGCFDVWTEAENTSAAYIANVSEDTTPQLGADLDGEGNNVIDTGVLFQREQADADADVAGQGQWWVNTATPNEPYFTDDAGNDWALVGALQTQTLENKTLVSPTINTSLNLDYATASELVATDGSKNLVSLAVATYPSLTELAYVKGVTSAIQTQLDAKEVQLDNEAGLYAVLSDVTDFYQPGDGLDPDDLNDEDQGDVNISSDVWQVQATQANAVDSDSYVDGSIDSEHPSSTFITGLTAVGTFESGDTFMCNEAGVGLRECDFDDLPSGGSPGTDSIGTDELDDGADTASSGHYLRVDTVDQAGIEYRSTAEVLSDIGAEGDLANEAGLYSALSDVSDFVQATETAAMDFGGATSLEIPNGTNPTTDTPGEIAIDTDLGAYGAIEIYGATGSSIIPATQVLSKTIWDPDGIQSTEDAIPLLEVTSDWAPHGITILDIELAADASNSGTYVIEEWTDPTTHSSDIESISFSTSTEAADDGTLSDSSVAAGSFVFIDLDTTSLNFLTVTITYIINEGD